MPKNVSLIAIILVLTFVVAGCSSKAKIEQTAAQTSQSLEIKVNDILTQELKSEKQVSNGQVYEQNGMVNGTILLEKGTSPEYAKTLADKYVEKLKEKYPGKRVNVQAVSDGKNLADVNFRP